MALLTWMIAPVRWRGVCIAFPALTLLVLLMEIRCNCGPVVAAVIDALQLLALAVGALGVVGYVRWRALRRLDSSK